MPRPTGSCPVASHGALQADHRAAGDMQRWTSKEQQQWEQQPQQLPPADVQQRYEQWSGEERYDDAAASLQQQQWQQEQPSVSGARGNDQVTPRVPSKLLESVGCVLNGKTFELSALRNRIDRSRSADGDI